MKPIFTFDEIRTVESEIINKEGIPSIVLMENAGRNSFEMLAEEFPDLVEYRVLIVCGKGNNAGDGFTLARHMLINGFDFKIFMLVEADKLKGDAAINYNILRKLCDINISCFSETSLDKYVKYAAKNEKLIIIDAILGTGVSGKLDELFSNNIKLINGLKKKFKNLRIVSLDVPSGLKSIDDNDEVIDADVTITMSTCKSELLFGKGREFAGNAIKVVPIGITDEILNKYNTYGKSFVEFHDIAGIFPKRKKVSHKYVNGKVLIIGGSKGLSGAAAMSSLSAIKSGAGGVAAAIPKSISRIFTGKLYEIMTVILDETKEGNIAADSYDLVKKRISWADAVLLGPGISTNDETKKFVCDVIENCDKNMVIDADALNIIAEDISILKRRKNKNEIILTPHLGEFSRLSGIEVEEITANRFEAARKFVKEYNVNLILKSETSISCLKTGEIFVNPTGNETLAMAGSGDVLSGLLVSMLAQIKDVKGAMLCGNFIHGMCADIYAAENRNSQSASPQDIIKLIPKAISEILEG
ncbi:MAG: NAD(P)H-hydrate dehydratase [Ignavibacteriae bacterium]|nr:MAG: NAD(P)H-hydrate dehydratase [Ignavibacteriota bacterium]